MKCLWIWAGSLSMPSSSCVLLLLNVDIVVVLLLPFCRCSRSAGRRVIPFINKTLILLHIRVDTVSSQRCATICKSLCLCEGVVKWVWALASSSARASRYGYSQTIIIDLKMAQLVLMGRHLTMRLLAASCPKFIDWHCIVLTQKPQEVCSL